jgi:DNA-directed RNA polymerase subunit F
VQPENRPGSAEYMAKLLKLPPDQRNRALSGLPPARRTQIEQRLNEYLKKPADERARDLEHLRRMQSLPPQKQNQVRASLRNLAALPQPRQRVVRQQINQLRPLSDTDRMALMNTEEFRNKFTPSEQQMIEDISLVTPRTEVATR